MRVLTIGYGAALTALGVGGFVASGRASRTALIPAAFGAPLIACGVAAFVPGARRVALGAASALALAGFAGSVRGVGKLPALLRGEAARPMAVASQSIMAGLSLLYALASRRGRR